MNHETPYFAIVIKSSGQHSKEYTHSWNALVALADRRSNESGVTRVELWSNGSLLDSRRGTALGARAYRILFPRNSDLETVEAPNRKDALTIAKMYVRNGRVSECCIEGPNGYDAAVSAETSGIVVTVY